MARPKGNLFKLPFEIDHDGIKGTVVIEYDFERMYTEHGAAFSSEDALQEAATIVRVALADKKAELTYQPEFSAAFAAAHTRATSRALRLTKIQWWALEGLVAQNEGDPGVYQHSTLEALKDKGLAHMKGKKWEPTPAGRTLWTNKWKERGR